MPKDFESFSHLIKSRQLCDSSRSFRLRRKLLEIRLFRSESLAGRDFLKVGSNRHFPRFWREMREDRREKAGDGHTPQNRASNRRKSIFEVLQMDVFPVNRDSVPEVMNKEQFFRICHISKSTVLHLLKSGKVPCEWSGKVVQKE